MEADRCGRGADGLAGLAKEDKPTALYNGMVHPLAPFAFRGVIWCQGEANIGEGMAYEPRCGH